MPPYLRVAHLEFRLLSPRWWWRIVVHSHLCSTVLATALVGLAARVTTLRGGLAESRFVMAFLLSLQLENLAEDKLLLISGMGALSLLVALAATGLHLLAGSNRALNVGLIVLLDRLGVLKPVEVRVGGLAATDRRPTVHSTVHTNPPESNQTNRNNTPPQAPASYLLHPLGRHHQVHRASSAAASAANSSKDALGASTSSSLDASGATAGSHSYNSHALKTPVKDPGAASPAAPSSAASRVSSLRKGACLRACLPMGLMRSCACVVSGENLTTTIHTTS